MSKDGKFGSVTDVNLGDYPIFKHYNDSEIATKVDSFRKGEFSLYTVFKVALFGSIGYFSWIYVLPPVFAAIGQMLAIASSLILFIVLIFLSPVILKGIRIFTRNVHKSLINYDPFAQLEIERQKMIVNLGVFRVAMQNIIGISKEMEITANNYETEGLQLQESIISLQKKATAIKDKMDLMVSKLGIEGAKNEDDYIILATKLQRLLGDSNRAANKLAQAKDFVQKYGAKGNVMKKMGHRLTLAENVMQIKIEDFDATVDMLKRDYEFGRKSNAATSAAMKVLGDKKDWEFNYTLDVIAATMSADMAITAGNMKDIDSITKNYNLDSDDMFTQLNAVADRIKIGTDVIPESKKYANIEYDLTRDDKLKAGKFGDLF